VRVLRHGLSFARGRWVSAHPMDAPSCSSNRKTVVADGGLPKGGQPRWRRERRERHGVDYAHTARKTSRPDGGPIATRDGGAHPRPSSRVVMYDNQGLRLLIDGLGPGYALRRQACATPLRSSLGMRPRHRSADAETRCSRNPNRVPRSARRQPNDTDLYGYPTRTSALEAFRDGHEPPPGC